MTVKVTKPQLRELRNIRDEEGPLNIRDEIIRVRLKNKGLAYCDGLYPWKWHLTDKGRAALSAREGDDAQA